MPEPDHLRRTRTAYDTVAVDYARVLAGELAGSPYHRAVLALYAELVDGPVAEVGCGPGRVTAHLAALGVDAYGIDLSPGMVAVAGETYPHLRFEVGTMTALDLPDAALGGVVSWYSLIHVPPADQPAVLAELARVLRPGGRLLLAFQVGDETRQVTAAYGHEVDVVVHRLPVDRVTADLTAAGFTVDATLVRAPVGEFESTPQAFLLATTQG